MNQKSIKFINYCGYEAEKYFRNFLVVLRQSNNTEYAVLRADNWAMGTGSANCIKDGTQWVNQTWCWIGWAALKRRQRRSLSYMGRMCCL